MGTKKTPSVSNVDLGGAAAALLLAAAGVVLWVRPAMVDRQTHEARRSEYQAVARDLADTEERRERAQAQAEAAREALAAAGGGLPPTQALDAAIKQLLSVAEDNALEVEELRPVGQHVRERWQEYQFELRARCGFPAFHRFCRALENELRFVEVPNYTIRREGDPAAQTRATVTCTVRFYFRSES